MSNERRKARPARTVKRTRRKTTGTMVKPPSWPWYSPSAVLAIKGERLALLGKALTYWTPDTPEHEVQLATFTARNGRPWIVYHTDACKYNSSQDVDDCDCIGLVLYPGAKA